MTIGSQPVDLQPLVTLPAVVLAGTRKIQQEHHRIRISSSHHRCLLALGPIDRTDAREQRHPLLRLGEMPQPDRDGVIGSL